MAVEFSPPVRPKVSSYTTEVAEITNDFGDNYEQTALDGINAVRIKKLTLSWPVLTKIQSVYIDSFFRVNAGRVIRWRLPQENEARHWRCSSWETETTCGMVSLTATLREVFV